MAAVPESPEGSRVPSWMAVAVIAVLATGLLTGYVVVGRWFHESAVRADRERMHAAAEPEIDFRVRQLAAWGDETLPEIVELCGDERPEFAAAARRVLAEELDRWRLMSAADATPKVELLAHELALCVDDWEADAQRAAAELAQRCLAWPLDPTAGSPTRVIADCEAILQAVGRRHREEIAQASYLDEPPGHPPRDPSPQQARRPSPDWNQLPPLAIEPPTVSPAVDPQPPQPIAPPARIPLPLSAPIAEPVAEEFPTVKLGPGLASPGKLQRPANPPRLSTPGGPPDLSASPPAAEVIDVRAAVRQLASSDPDAALAAEKALRGLEWKDFDLAVARRATSPLVADRLRLCDELPGLPLDARPWLLLLAEDEDFDVRDRARSILATSNDARLRR